jgi:hypothetical protein
MVDKHPDGKIKDRAGIEKASHLELSQHIVAHSVRPHYFEYNTHYHSERLRKMAKETPLMVKEINTLSPTDKPMEYEFYKDLADQLDSLHQQFHHRGTGRVVVHTEDELRTMALALHDGTHKVLGGKVVPNAQQESNTSEVNGSGRTQSTVREESRSPAGGGEGVQSSGQENRNTPKEEKEIERKL